MARTFEPANALCNHPHPLFPPPEREGRSPALRNWGLQRDWPGGVVRSAGVVMDSPHPSSLLSSRSTRLRRFALLPRWGWQFEVPIWSLRHRLAPPAGRNVATSRAAGVK